MPASEGDSRKRATIRDVSARSGVSIGTVSNVINAPKVVAEATRRRVEQVIAELGYAPAAAARSLKSRRAFMVGYPIYETVPAPIMRTFFRQFLRRAATHGLGVNAFPAKPDDFESSFTRLLDSGAVDGFILASVTDGDPRVDWMLENDIPFAGFGRTLSEHQYPCVDVDVVAGGQLLARHVLDLGHERIAHIGTGIVPADHFRVEGIAAELEAQGLGLIDGGTCDLTVGNAEQLAAALLSRPDPPTAILCGQDVIAAGAVRLAMGRDLAIGGDLVITGFEDTPLGVATYPSLTTVSFPMTEVARHCVDMLVNRLQGESPSTTLVQPELVVRESTSGR